MIEDDPRHILLLQLEFGHEYSLSVSESVPAARGLIELYKQGKVRKPDVVLLDGDLGTSRNGCDAKLIHSHLHEAGVLADDDTGVGALIIGNSADHDMRDVISRDFPAELNARKNPEHIRKIIEQHFRAA